MIYLDINVLYKHIFAHIYGILMILDYCKFYPIRDTKLSIMYGALVIEFEWILILVSIFELPRQ